MDVSKQKEFKNIFLTKYNNEFYKTLIEYLWEEIFVTDGAGKILFVNSVSEHMIGLPADQMVGRSAGDLEKEGYLSESSTIAAMRQRKTVNILQKLKNGRTVLATSVPIFNDEQDEIMMIISSVKDVEAVNEWVHRVKKQAYEIEKSKTEVYYLGESMFEAEGFISRDPVMNELKETLMRIAPLEISVLIQGKTGVGKEVVAKALHRLSCRSEKPFVKINCGTIPEQLIESELFGYEKGAFTGANVNGKKGMVEIAHEGTLFFDEIGELPLPLQVKLLGFLEDGTFSKVGGTEYQNVNVRVVAATNRNLREMCMNGKFRKDLYYRLNVIPINIPPLSDRIADIEVLTEYFMSQCNSKYRYQKKMESGFLEILTQYSWPGNIRELKNIVERLCIISVEDVITKEELKKAIYENTEDTNTLNFMEIGIGPLKEAKWELEKHLVSKAYKTYQSTYKAAEALHIDQSTVVKLLHKHNCIL